VKNLVKEKNVEQEQIEAMKEIWKEMDEQIPFMREAVRKGLAKDLKAFKHDDKHIQRELEFLNEALNFLQKKWTMDLIYIIRIMGKSYFNDIRRALPNINSRSLSTRLKDLEENQIVIRNVETSDKPPFRVSYKLTNLGEGIYELLLPLLLFFSRERNKFETERK
jgi:DNA-binding HxlR family transcriptional regulator